MDKNYVMVRVAAILTTLLETNGAPESYLYIFMDMDMDKWQTIRRILIEAGFVQIKSNYVTLTQLGIQTAEKLDKAISN